MMPRNLKSVNSKFCFLCAFCLCVLVLNYFMYGTVLRSVYKYIIVQDWNKTTSSTTRPTQSRELITPTQVPQKIICFVNTSDLVGELSSNQGHISADQLQILFKMVRNGGHYSPPDCTATEKVAIVIPYRNREDHLHILLHNLIPFLIRQLVDFTIFVIEQELPTAFNRAMLFNIGFLEALKLSENFTCFIFHDVDLVPLNDHCLYKCSDHPRHLTAAINKWNYNLPYPSYFGGVAAMTKQQYQDINGASNLYFGWGGEDDDLYSRVNLKGYKLLRYSVEIGKYDMIKHQPDSGNSPNNLRFKLLSLAGSRQKIDGLNTTIYNVTRIHKYQLYTWIFVFINKTQVIQTAPDNLKKDLMIDLTK